MIALLACVPALAGSGGNSPTPDNEKLRIAVAARHPEPTYRLSVGLDGEIYPVFAHYAALQRQQERAWGTVMVRVANHANGPLRNRVSVRVRGWSDEEVQVVELGASEARTLLFAPTFLPRTFQNKEIAAATAVVTVTDMAGNLIYTETAPVRMRSVDDMYWGTEFKFARFIASWVTPHDARVEAVLGRAKEFMPGRRLPGYEPWKNPGEQREATMQQARAIYRALQDRGVSYVKSSITFGQHGTVSERVRMPNESLRHASANCIDGVVMFASLFENLGMDPTVVLVPGHAYVGVRLAEGNRQFLYIDTALTGRATFDEAVRNAEAGIARLKPQQINRISVAEAREAGIFPMPSSEQDATAVSVAATRAQ